MNSDVDLQALREASDRGDLAARTALALRLLRSPQGRGEGMALLLDAARIGGGEANAMLATFVAGGVTQAPDWNIALQHLAVAAEAGWQSARDELRFLANEQGELPWREMAKRADIGRWLSPPRARVVVDAPRIAVIEGFLSPEACSWFMSLGQGKLKPAAVYDASALGSRLSEQRTNSDYPFELFNARVSTCLLQARIEAALAAPVENFEAMMLMHYAPGQTFNPHHDYLDPREPGPAEDIRQRGQRVATVLVYLNENYEGGETEFPALDFSFRGKRGDALAFANVGPDSQPDQRSLHAGRPPSSGEKWLLSQWIRDRPQAW